MKLKFVYLGSVIALLGLFTACNDEKNGNTDGGEGTLVVSLQGEYAQAPRATDNPSVNDEQKIFNYNVYVCDKGSGRVEHKTTFDPSDPDNPNTEIITGLKFGDKKIVVIANIPDEFPTNIANYSEFNTIQVRLEKQRPDLRATKGLIMSGESEVRINADHTVDSPLPVKIKISRVVAKVMLKSITISPAAEYPGTFTLKGVSIQKAKPFSTVGPTTLTPALINSRHWGGVHGSSSDVPNITGVNNFLLDNFTTTPPIDQKLDCTNYFYVFPNAITGQETLLTISGVYTYQGVSTTFYYPFRINDLASSTGGNSTDGQLIKRNHIYHLNVKLMKVGNGSKDPDEPDTGSAEITIEQEPWEMTIVQNVEW